MAVDLPREAERVVTERRAGQIAWSLVTFCVALAVVAIVMGLLNPPSKNVEQWGSTSVFGATMLIIPNMVAPVVGGLIASKRPRNPIGWILIVVGLLWMTIAFHDTFLAYWQNTHNGAEPPFLDWVGVFGWLPAMTLLGVFTLLLFPDGKLPSKRWRPVFWAGAFLLVVGTPVTAAMPDDSGAAVSVPPVIHALEPIASKLTQVIFLLPICMLLAVASLFVRYRRASLEDRGKLKWIAFGTLVGLLYFVFTMVFSVVFDHPGGALVPVARFLQSGVFFAVAMIPLSIGFAILRYKLFDIDRIISRTVSYILMTVVLAATYMLVVLVPTTVASGRSAPQWLIAVGTLVVAGLFTPVRRRLQRAVDHRFNRRRFDAVQTVERFAARLREEIDIDELGPALRTVVKQTMDPAHVSLWLASTP